MRKLVVLGIIALLMAGVAMAADNSAMGVGKTQNVTFFENVRVGNAVLKAGDYRVKHEMDGTNHVLVFRSADRNQEKARVNCTMVELPKKSEHTLFTFDKGQAGEKVLVGLIFRGDTYKHQL